ncbi:MAG: hypothetical protein JNG90_18070, partial [Planctomycetaceae bacterium]|nr:hypothetical protein [Planctomycetaceae bacterium]
VVQNGEELTAFVRRCLEEPAFGERLGTAAARFVASQLGATGRTVDRVEQLLTARRKALPTSQRAA